jgi:hypothetical protein
MNPLALMQMVAQIKSNPMSVLGQFGVPQNIAGNPQDVLQYLMNNGKISQSQYDAAVRHAQNMGLRF